jgi:hypothetical protein
LDTGFAGEVPWHSHDKLIRGIDGRKYGGIVDINGAVFEVVTIDGEETAIGREGGA